MHLSQTEQIRKLSFNREVFENCENLSIKIFTFSFIAKIIVFVTVLA